ncbi:glucitol/sorbitol PTS system EIIB component [Aerococcus sp. 150760007-1]|uniref:PTS glucitol/sorbitol transporter subunit IIB n=1 Tax=Aerococcus urinaeequi TaxID=51665 RepID=A0ABR5ZY96_9LACT|nr:MULTISPECIES: PTS glucitol/sorbitol transporter subunit IIB [Lactobacillales]KAF3306371.1 PTS sorbitol transporter subunit IIB [Carnobacterium sp. PL17GRE32]MBA5746722.1 PTS glucitol/sorbitol transporter subunit IIB [Aerococcus urinaeequi]MBA5829483.1 PTS glucitol/sorbitol transporter subunit IIB [Aerococcus urinaeequi]MBA5860410.1 PTS glucitol/sorbitol transporter subunit IIB [Aerococcus urinaeequi]
MTTYKSIKVSKGSGGFGGPLVITPTEQKHKFIYVVGGGERPAIVDKIEELTGMEAVNGFKTSIPDDEIALAIIDCGGTLRCGIYPKKGIPTINVLPTGKAGPLAQYITEDIYVSKVSNSQIELYQESEEGQPLVSEETASPHNKDEKKPTYDTSKKMTQQGGSGIIGKIGLAVGSFMATINQSAREAVQTMLTTVIPFMAFVSLIIGLIQGSGVGKIIANFMAPLAGNVFGLIVIGFICSVPFLSPLLGPGAVVSQVIGALIGVEIGKGNIPPQLALPALFAINTQNGCDFIPVALGLAEADSETVEVGVPAVLYSRFINGVPRVVVAWLASFGLYK